MERYFSSLKKIIYRLNYAKTLINNRNDHTLKSGLLTEKNGRSLFIRDLIESDLRSNQTIRDRVVTSEFLWSISCLRQVS